MAEMDNDDPGSPWSDGQRAKDNGGIEASASHVNIVKTAPKPGDDVDVAMALFDHPDQIHEPRDPGEERRLVRKIDFMVLPYLAVCYAFFYIDKTTLSYAAIFGIRQDLDLEGPKYNWLSSIFYFGFLVWAFPTNFMMQKFPIGKYLGINIFLWGGLLGYGIGSIKGSVPSWKYEFLIIGALCCIWGIVMFIFLPDSPVTAKGLNRAEKRMAVQRLRENQTGVENKHLKWHQVREAFLDVKMYLFFLLGLVCNVPNGGISNFGTLIIQGFGFSTLVTTLMQVPYGIIIAVSILSCVYLNNRFVNKRCLFILVFLLPNIAGSFGLRFVPADRQIARLMCYYLTGPYNAAFVLVLSLQTANTAGHTKKVVTNAVLFLGYCAGNISGPFFYLNSQAPYYELGIWSMIVSHLLEVCIISTFWILMSRENRRRDKIQSEMDGGLQGRDLDSTAFADMTDRENLNFRYIY
ncbi:hypothetical protein LQW54_010940 [Pestalotiopsis sp. IQ-011]